MSYDFSMSYKVLLWHHISDGNSACPLCSVFQTPMGVWASGRVSVLQTSTHPVIKIPSSRRVRVHRLENGISLTVHGEWRRHFSVHGDTQRQSASGRRYEIGGGKWCLFHQQTSSDNSIRSTDKNIDKQQKFPQFFGLKTKTRQK